MDTIRVLYPDLSTEDGLGEVINTGNNLDVTVFQDQRSEVEVESGEGPVTITGSQLDDTISGSVGNDTISGGDGNDFLNVGSGDTISGGAGTDIFHFDLSQELNINNLPTITDFKTEDLIAISNAEDSSEAPVYDRHTGTLLIGDEELANIGMEVDSSAVKLKVNDVDEPFVSQIDSEETTIYRFYDPSAGAHFYTVDEVEKDSVMENLDNYDFEGESYNIVDPITGGESEQVYRFFNSSTGVHLYTTSEVERDSIIDNLDNFTYEGVKFYAYETQVEGSMPVHRFYEASLGVHFYTPSEVEKDSVMDNLDNYDYEGIAYYALPIDGDMSDM